MSIRGAAFIAGAYEHPDRFIPDKPVEQVHAEVAAGALADAGLTFADVDAYYGPKWDVLVNVVGGTFRQPFEESNSRGWDALIRANFTWLLHSTQLAIARMRPEGGSRSQAGGASARRRDSRIGR